MIRSGVVVVSQGTDDGFGHSSACAVRILHSGTLVDERPFESALVFGLPHEINSFVLELRAKYPRHAPPEDQLVPHITLLYLGVMPGHALGTIHRELKAHLPAITARAAISGFGIFNSIPQARNWHLTIAPVAPFAAIRQRLEGLCTGSGWRSTQSYSGDRFVPHITIWDRFEGSVPDCDPTSIPLQSFDLKGIVHIGRELTGVANV